MASSYATTNTPVTDAGPPGRRGERLGRGQRMAAAGGGIAHVGQVGVQVEKRGTRDVAGLEALDRAGGGGKVEPAIDELVIHIAEDRRTDPPGVPVR